MKIVHLTILCLILAAGARAGPGSDEYRRRRRDLEVRFAEEYARIAVRAKKLGDRELALSAFRRAEELDPGNDTVIGFDPEVRGKPRRTSARRLEKLRAALAAVRKREARARRALATWCDAEALPDEATAEAVIALSLDPGPILFDEEGVLRGPVVGKLPKALSLAVLDEHEVFRGRLVARDEVPGDVSWEDGWKLATAHFRIRTNVSGRICRTVGRALEAAREIYREESGFDVAAPITVHVFAARSAYERALVDHGMEKPPPWNIGRCAGDYCAVDGTRSEDEVVSVTIHEVAHGYYHLGHEALAGKRGVGMPTWFAEGYATYCAGYGPGSLSWRRGVVLPEIAREKPLARFREMVREGKEMPLEEFLSTKEGDSRFYYQAYAFYWFFHETKEEALRKRWRSAVRRMCRAALTDEDRIRKGNAIFRDALGDAWPTLQERFLAWVRSYPSR